MRRAMPKERNFSPLVALHVTDWTAALFFRREVVSLGQLQEPKSEFQQAAGERKLPEVS